MESNKLFLQNYRNENECAELKHFVKTITKEFKKTGEKKVIKYYPWAVIERLFRNQGGKVEVVEWAMKVELTGKDYAPNEMGELVLQETKTNALFIHLKATWQGQEEHEYYPIFDNQNAKIIKIPDALDLNTAKQRGMVRLIARISGIGLEIFEQQEGQFEEEKEVPPTITVKKKNQSDSSSNPSSNDMFSKLIGGSTKVEEPAPEPTPEPTPEPAKVEEVEFGTDTQEYADLLLEVRKTIRETSTQAQAKAFLADKGKELLSQLNYAELQELKASLV
jgi:hypothetical protein